MTRHGLQRNVEEAYRRLMQCHEPGDRVYLFGFSRGAFTVRSLAGMLHKCGLLGPGHENLVEYASRIYNTEGNEDIAAGFRSTFGRDCPVEFIGVWGTVDSLAMNAGKKWHDHTLNPEVRFGYHALAIDERRRDFEPCPWDEADAADGQTIEQVWFAGVHSGVGGWYDERGLSNVALHWMLEKTSACGLRVGRAGLASRPPDPHDTMHQSCTGIWKARPRRTRKIPEGARVHRSVFERRDGGRVRYDPKNLTTQPQRRPPRRGAGGGWPLSFRTIRHSRRGNRRCPVDFSHAVGPGPERHAASQRSRSEGPPLPAAAAGGPRRGHRHYPLGQSGRVLQRWKMGARCATGAGG